MKTLTAVIAIVLAVTSVFLIWPNSGHFKEWEVLAGVGFGIASLLTIIEFAREDS